MFEHDGVSYNVRTIQIVGAVRPAEQAKDRPVAVTHEVRLQMIGFEHRVYFHVEKAASDFRELLVAAIDRASERTDV